MKNSLTIQSHIKVVLSLLHNLMVNNCEGMLCDYDVFPKSGILPLFKKLIKNQTKITLTQNWALEIFSITPYIAFKYIKGKDNLLAGSLTQLQRLGLYEKCPCEEDDQDQEITIFDEGESIEVTVNPESFSPQIQT